MRIGKSSDYGIMAALHIAINENQGAVPGSRIARDCGIPAQCLNKILLRLVRGGIVYSKRGPGGGFTMAKPPRRVTLLEIVELIEGRFDRDLLLSDKINIPASSRRKLQSVRKDIFRSAKSRLAKTTIKQLMD